MASRLRRANAVFRRRTFFRGESVDPSGQGDVTWLQPDGLIATDAQWHDLECRSLGMLIPARSADPRDERGRAQAAETALLLLNAYPREQTFTLPELGRSGTWHEILDTASDEPGEIAGAQLALAPHSLVLLAFRDRA